MLKFSIIGCGQMGAWFAKSIRKRGGDLILYDLRRDRAVRLARSVAGRYVTSLERIPHDRPLLLALPVKATGEVLNRLTQSASRQVTAVEISAYKRPVWSYVLRARRNGHVVASIHPLFGPGQADDRGTVTLHVGRRSPLEDRLVRMLLPRTRVERVSVAGHDRAILVALALTHFIGVTASELLSRVKTVGVETKSFKTLMSLISICLSEPEEFYSDYPMTDERAVKLFKKYGDAVDYMISQLEEGRAARRVRTIGARLQSRYDFNKLYKQLYSVPK